MLSKLFKIFAAKRLFEMFRSRGGAGRRRY